MEGARKNVFWFVAEIDKKNAGYRVRALPLANELRLRGSEVELIALDEMPSRVNSIKEAADIVICAKPNTPEVYFCLKQLKDAGIAIVIDLFDNYFSWSPFLLDRQIQTQWLKFLLLADHVFVSTSFLRGVIAAISDTPTTLIGDALPPVPPVARVQKWANSTRLDVLWFGINSNPFFRAGLDDLSAWKGVLTSLASKLLPEKKIRLTICTNPTPSLVHVLESFGNTGIETVYSQWSEEVCNDLLESAHVVLLPTNMTGFSLSKTHNRCSDALVRNCLVLGSPNGPYKEIPGAVFSNVESLHDFLHAASAEDVRKLVQTSIDHLAETHELSSIVDTLDEVIQGLARSGENSREAIVVLLGKALETTPRTIQKLNQEEELPQYVIAGFDPLIESTMDMRLAIDDDHQVKLTLTKPGYRILSEALERNEEAKLGASHEWQVRNYRYSFHPSKTECLITSPELAESIKKSRALYPLHERHANFMGAWFAVQTKILTQVLVRAGIQKLELATYAESGWKKFAENADPVLNEKLDHLSQLQIAHECNEIEWGEAS